MGTVRNLSPPVMFSRFLADLTSVRCRIKRSDDLIRLVLSTDGA